jgi:hypothetical protein
MSAPEWISFSEAEIRGAKRTGIPNIRMSIEDAVRAGQIQVRGAVRPATRELDFVPILPSRWRRLAT